MFSPPFLKIFCFCFFNVNYWQYFFTAPLKTAPIYITLRPNVDTVCFQRTKRLQWLLGRVLVEFNWILFFNFNCYSFGSLIFKFNHSKIYTFSQELQVNNFYSLGCYLTFLMLLSVSVLRKFLWFFELLNFFILFQSTFCLFSVGRGQYFLLIEKKTNFVADCFNRRFSCFWYYKFSYKIFWFLWIIAQFCCCFLFLL